MYPGDNGKEAVNWKDIQGQNVTALDEMNVLVLGSGGREHALAWKIAQSPYCRNLFVAPGNAGTAEVGKNVPIKVGDFEAIKQFCIEQGVQMVVVGPDPCASEAHHP